MMEDTAALLPVLSGLLQCHSWTQVHNELAYIDTGFNGVDVLLFYSHMRTYIYYLHGK